jgi:GTP-binding protein
MINRQLAEHSPALADKPQIIALNKMDLHAGEADAQTAIELISEALGRSVHPLSAATGEGTRDLLQACWHRLHPAGDHHAGVT